MKEQWKRCENCKRTDTIVGAPFDASLDMVCKEFMVKNLRFVWHSNHCSAQMLNVQLNPLTKRTGNYITDKTRPFEM